MVCQLAEKQMNDSFAALNLAIRVGTLGVVKFYLLSDNVLSKHTRRPPTSTTFLRIYLFVCLKENSF